MSEWEERRVRDLAQLRGEWGDLYQIDWVLGQFRAERRGDGAAVLAKTPHHLVRLMEEDHAARPIPRQARAADWQ